MAIIKATPEALSIDGLLPALCVKYGTIVLKSVDGFIGDPSGLVLTLQVYHKTHPDDYELDILIHDTDEGLKIEER